MLKFINAKVTFSEVPEEISLCINITGCKNACPGCHSAYLAQDIGSLLNKDSLFDLLDKNKGISCVSFMGGDAHPELVNTLAFYVKEFYPNPIKVAWYSGKQELSDKIELKWFDFIKLGPYIKKLGPLNNKTTNQKFYKVHKTLIDGKISWELEDETFKFWEYETEN